MEVDVKPKLLLAVLLLRRGLFLVILLLLALFLLLLVRFGYRWRRSRCVLRQRRWRRRRWLLLRLGWRRRRLGGDGRVGATSGNGGSSDGCFCCGVGCSSTSILLYIALAISHELDSCAPSRAERARAFQAAASLSMRPMIELLRRFSRSTKFSSASSPPNRRSISG